jgi:hypothetical protein
MAFNVNSFRANGLKLGGARPTQFEVFIFPPFGSNASKNIQFLARATQIPPAPLDSIPVPYFGRKIKIAGDREFPDWTVTILNDESFDIRVMMESWSNRINTMVSNVQDESMFPMTYKSTAKVIQYGKRGNAIRAYDFVGIFPTNVDAIPLDWDQTNTVEQFDVTFAYDYWIPDNEFVTSPDDFTGVSANDGIGG